MKLLPVLFSAILFITGCSDNRYFREFELDESTFDAEAMQEIQKMSGFNIPENSRGLNFAYRPPIDPEFATRIEIPPESEETVLKQIENLEGQALTSSGGLPEKLSWWPRIPENVLSEKRVFNSDSKNPNNGYFHAILTRENGKLILYLNYHTP